MKIVISPQSFKGTFGAMEVAEAIKKGAESVFLNANFLIQPVADGGEGTAEILCSILNCTKKFCQTTDALGRKISAPWCQLQDGTAVIELAKVSGLTMLSDNEKNPLFTTTDGVGEIILAAIDAGAKKIIIGVGGSSTNDGGAGIAQRLGIKFLDQNGRELPKGGAALKQLKEIDLTTLDSRVSNTEILIACDVTNPMTGPNGASKIFSPQKGATPEMVAILEEALLKFAEITKKCTSIDLNQIKRAGAAGGAAGGMMALLGAKLISGTDFILDAMKFDQLIKGADLVITGEGSLDRQTLENKATLGVVLRAKKEKIPTVAIVGKVEGDMEQFHAVGFDQIVALNGRAIETATEEGCRKFQM